MRDVLDIITNIESIYESDTALSVLKGAKIVRVHDVKETVDALRVFNKLIENK